MVYITGDTHGEIGRLNLGYTKDDLLIIAGDFGFVFDERSYKKNLEYISSLEYNIAFVDGNHEAFPLIYSYPEEIWNNGRIHRLLANLIHLERGQVFNIEGMTIFTMGGGFSMDKDRRVKDVSWWEQELPNEKEYEEGLSNLARCQNRVDYIISHTAPIETMELLRRNNCIDHLRREESRLDNYLQYVDDITEYKQHFFGHLHLDSRLWRKQTALFRNIICLNTFNN